ncbi:hypothetical protein HYC85_009297 [Camellia sinensis]|uniref:Uncharacterized protein n=1 Tax=Camellia sinensis TaxID=4442 RepID=A0A7J7HEK9_CAMSI|nr:hypothetical protein HYC85_009297 [Camellia sinensis]
MIIRSSLVSTFQVQNQKGAQMSEILIWPDIIYQSWIDGSLGSSSSRENSCRIFWKSVGAQVLRPGSDDVHSRSKIGFEEHISRWQCGFAEKDKLPNCGLKYAFELQML